VIDVLVDSSVMIDVLRGQASSDRFGSLVARRATFGITDVVYAELRSVDVPRRIANALDRFVDEGRVLELVDLEDFERGASCRRAADRAGVPVRSIADCLIASVCIREGLPLLHRDRDFDRLAACTDLQVISLLS
jgi:predicted nucleic acid-binding protein